MVDADKEPSNALLALPNILTLCRLPLAAIVWVAPSRPAWVLGVLGAAALTDMLDGFVARRIRSSRWVKTRAPGSFSAGTGLGAFLDPLVDKVFITSVVLVIWWAYGPAPLVLVAIVARELLMAVVMLAFMVLPGTHRTRTDFTANLPGKLATVAQFVALISIVLGFEWFELTAWVAGALGILAVVIYVVRARRATGDEPVQRS